MLFIIHIAGLAESSRQGLGDILVGIKWPWNKNNLCPE